jgi:hypothetical protein
MTKSTNIILLIGLFVSFPFIAACGVYAAVAGENLQWRLYDDGTYDVVAGKGGGNAPSLLKCFPAFDDKLLTPKSVTIKRTDEIGRAHV